MAPNRSRNSSTVSPTNSSGTADPSLNRRGSRISNRRSVLLIGSWTHDRKGNALRREGGQGTRGHGGFAAGPGFEGEAAGQVTQGAALGRGVGEANADHV